MVSDALRIGMSGLLAAQKSIDVTAGNVANASTPGYTRQRVDQASSAIGQGGIGGVNILGVTRIRDVFADASWRSEASVSESANARADVLERAETSLGPLGENIASLLDSFFSAWNQLSTAPTDVAAREGVLGNAQALAAEYQRVHAALGAQVGDAKVYATSAVDEANGLFAQIARLNSSIAEAKQVNANASGLLDERDKAFDRIAELLGGNVRIGQNGEPQIQVSGFPVVQGDYPVKLEVLGDASPGNPLRVAIVGGNTLQIPGGRVGGILTAINIDLPNLEAKLDAAAAALKTTINAQHTAGFDLQGNPGLDLFVGTGAADLEVDPSMTASGLAASASGAAGDGNNALALAQLRLDPSPSSAANTVRTYIVELGAEIDSARRLAVVAETALTGTENIRQQSMGVNIDEEMVDLIRYQRAFQAAAQAIRVADEVLDTLINRMIR